MQTLAFLNWILMVIQATSPSRCCLGKNRVGPSSFFHWIKASLCGSVAVKSLIVTVMGTRLLVSMAKVMEGLEVMKPYMLITL
jgi:hypothetical protein